MARRNFELFQPRECQPSEDIGKKEGWVHYFAQQLAMFSLAPIVTNLAGNMLIDVLLRLTGQVGDKFGLLGNS